MRTARMRTKCGCAVPMACIAGTASVRVPLRDLKASDLAVVSTRLSWDEDASSCYDCGKKQKEFLMSWQPSNDPVLGDPKTCDALDLIIVPRTRDLGEASRCGARCRIGKRQMVGPFIFFDQMGPVQFMRRPGHGCSPASAYRACHRHLSVRRRDHAPRQRGQRCWRSGPAR